MRKNRLSNASATPFIVSSDTSISSGSMRLILLMALFHILVIASSNYLVQIPFQMFGLHTTWGAFTFPFAFLATDLTVRLFGRKPARKIVLCAMFPALLVSYLVSVLFDGGQYHPEGLTSFNAFVGRIALASFTAYLLGQLLDITIFNRLRQLRRWWIAPAASTVFGNLLDTLCFFSVAFYHSDDVFMAGHWPEIAAVDYGWKLIISMLLFLPLYGLLLNALQKTLQFSKTGNSWQTAGCCR